MHVWFWSWIILAVVFALGESVTGGLFVLPWSGGAVLAAILDAIGLSITWQWLAFICVSSILLVVAQRRKRDRE